TLESRICDVSPRLEDALSMAAATQAIMRMLWRLKKGNHRWRTYDRFLIEENRWRAQRYGMSEGLIDFGAGAIVPFSDLLTELIALISEDAEALSCMAEVEALAALPARGNSADRQRAVYKARRDAGGNHAAGLAAVTRHLIEEFHADL
ncbi:MAG: carboxylate-amine ligase, partial [Pseudomonadota bacterium]